MFLLKRHTQDREPSGDFSEENAKNVAHWVIEIILQEDGVLAVATFHRKIVSRPVTVRLFWFAYLYSILLILVVSIIWKYIVLGFLKESHKTLILYSLLRYHLYDSLNFNFNWLLLMIYSFFSKRDLSSLIFDGKGLFDRFVSDSKKPWRVVN